MLRETARVLGLRRLIVPVPLLSPPLSSYWLTLMTPVPYKVGAALVEGLKCEPWCRTTMPAVLPAVHSNALCRERA